MSLWSAIRDLFTSNGKKPLFGDKEIGIASIGSGSFSVTGDKERCAALMSSVHFLSRQMSMICPLACINGKTNEKRSVLNETLSLKPNPVQTASDFYASLFRDYFLYGIGIAYLRFDYSNPVEPLQDIWVLDPAMIKVYNRGNVIFLQATTSQGEEIYAPMDDFLIMLFSPDSSKMFPEQDPSLESTIRILEANDKGFEQAIKSSHLIRYVLTSSSPLNPTARNQFRKDFNDQVSVDENGLVVIGNATSLTPISQIAVYAKQPELDESINNIYAHYGLTKAMIQCDFSENQYQAIHEGNIDSISNALCQQLTIKIFSQRERQMGNAIVIDTNPIDHASMATRVNIANSLMSCGMYRPNDVMKILNLDPMEGGDKPIQSLNYAAPGKTGSKPNADKGDSQNGK